MENWNWKMKKKLFLAYEYGDHWLLGSSTIYNISHQLAKF